MSTYQLMYDRYKKLFLNKQDVAEVLDISPATLQRKMATLDGIPPFIKDEKTVKFRLSDVANFVDNRKPIKTHY